MDPLLSRITFNPDKNGDRASIRDMRIRVQDILELLAEDVPVGEILAEFPELEADDIRASLAYAAAVTGDVKVAAA